jgi:uncharacterized protein (TIGR00730 family)
MINETANTTVTTEPLAPHRHLTPEEIKQGCVEIGGSDETGVRICRINEELHQGLTEMEAYDKSVTFYGSARFVEGDPYYDRARKLGYRISKELGYTITTGGGPGIMEGGNRGAYEAGGKSVGLSIKLPMEQTDNPYTTDLIPFYFFFARKVTLSFSASVFIYFPGGFGTLDEFFEVVTLIQTKKLLPVPIVLYGSDYWGPIKDLMQKLLLDKFKTIDAEDLNLFTITDSDDEVLDIIRNSKPRTGNHGDLRKTRHGGFF